MEHEGAQTRDELYETGLTIRREVLGDDYVDESLAGITELTGPLQRLVTEYCWGWAWSRPQLERRTRSLLNIGMLTALGKSRELAAHVRGARRNGCSVEEIREVILEAAIYCGVPAALEAMRTAGSGLEPSLVDADDGE